MLTLRKTDQARQVLAQGHRELPSSLRALLITINGKRSEDELLQLSAKLGLGQAGLQRLMELGLIEKPAVDHVRDVRAQAQRLVSAKFFALDLVTRMLAGREADLRAQAKAVTTESRFAEWVDLCCGRIEEHADAERAKFFRERVEASIRAS